MNQENVRPLSPHLTIYRPQITSMLSIMHRISGACLFIGMLVLSWWIITAIYSSFDPNVAKWDFLTNNIIGKLILFAWTHALFYHLLNGIRHLFWDAGYGYDIKIVRLSGILVLLGTIILSFLSWWLALGNLL